MERAPTKDEAAEQARRNIEASAREGHKGMKNFLVTYATEGIGLLTAILLAQNKAMHIGLHGTDKKQLEVAITKIKEVNPNIDLKTFCYRLDNYAEVQDFASEIGLFYKLSNFGPQLDCFLNFANFTENGSQTFITMPSGKKVERTFMLNVWAPYQLSVAAFTETSPKVKRVIIPSSDVHMKSYGTNKLDFTNLQFEKGNWTKNEAYVQSKLLQVMMTRGLFLQEIVHRTSTAINLHMTSMNEKLLDAFLDGGNVFMPGIPMEKAKEPFALATETKYENAHQMPKYYEGLLNKTPARQCCDREACVDLARYLKDLN